MENLLRETLSELNDYGKTWDDVIWIGEENRVDHLIRHKWPEEKPEELAKYIIRIEYEDNGAIVSETTIDEWNGFNWYEYREDCITHWWNLQEATK